MKYSVRDLISEKINTIMDETTVSLEEFRNFILDEDYSREWLAEELTKIIDTLC